MYVEGMNTAGVTAPHLLVLATRDAVNALDLAFVLNRSDLPRAAAVPHRVLHQFVLPRERLRSEPEVLPPHGQVAVGVGPPELKAHGQALPVSLLQYLPHAGGQAQVYRIGGGLAEGTHLSGVREVILPIPHTSRSPVKPPSRQCSARRVLF